MQRPHFSFSPPLCSALDPLIYPSHDKYLSRLSSPTSPAGRFAKLAKKTIAEHNVADSRSSSEKSGRLLVDPCCSHFQ